ncbi:MAG: hypothetical protein K2Z81_12760, partial [Cyanobacteria bacterium]|nr:hypothetical protein [Cyanobacteriota bacterium]
GKVVPFIVASLVGVFVLWFAFVTISNRQPTGPLKSQQLPPSLRHLAAPEIHGWWKITMYVNQGNGDVEASHFTTKVDQYHTGMSGNGKDAKGAFAIEGRIQIAEKSTLIFTKTYTQTKTGQPEPTVNYQGMVQNGESTAIASGEYSFRMLKNSALARSDVVHGNWAAESVSGPNLMEELMNGSSSTQSKVNPLTIILALIVGIVVLAFMMKNRPQKSESKNPTSD